MVLYNPHVDDFIGKPFQFYLVGRRPLKKYGFLLSEPLKRKIKIKIFKDSSISCIIPMNLFIYLPKFIRFLVSEAEFRIWLYINELKKENFILLKHNDLEEENMLTFSYKSATGLFQERKKVFDKCKNVVFHLSHYFVNTKVKSKNIRMCKNSILAGDSDITENSFFKKYFFWYKKDFLILHFAVQERFKNIKKFPERINSAITTGSYHNLSEYKPRFMYSDFIEHFDSNSYHLLREELSKDKIKSENLKSYISLYNEPSNFSYIRNIIPVSSQKNYFAIDIVNEYNKYKFALVGEELSGFPAIGAFEAMGCGCVLIAQKDFYCGLGLEPNINFLEYDGTINGFYEVLNNSLNHVNLSHISKASVDYINLRFSEDIVYNSWSNNIRNLKT